MQTEMCAALARPKGASQYTRWRFVTLCGEAFKANRGLIESMVDAMRVKHPDIDYKVEVVI